ncbi:glycerol-3-phosphate acyltransferase [Cyanobacterium aponinum]
MTMTQIGGILSILIIPPIIGAIPLIDWFTYAVSGKELTKLGTGNISVSAAFYHGGKLAGILAVLSEAGKGVGVVLLSRIFFPSGSFWEIIALIMLILGRYYLGKGAGATNLTWGIVTHNPVAALLIFILGGVSFTIWREKQAGRISVLVLMVVVLSAQNINHPEYILLTIILASLMIWIYRQMADDLELNPSEVNGESAKMFRFFRGDSGIISLNEALNPQKVGAKASNLSRLKKWGYNVPDGWVLKIGDDIHKLQEFINPSSSNPYVVRSSALDEDTNWASAAGIYDSFVDLTDFDHLSQAVIDCFSSYNSAIALDYRQRQKQSEKGIAVIIQKQINGIYSGVIFSRDPVNQLEDTVCIEAVSGMGLKLVSGEVTPQQYRVFFPEEKVKGEGDISQEVLLNLGKIAREIEHLCQGIPQDIEWTYDGEKIWLLQTRPITTLKPVWTRKIAAEVIPGVIRPLTWSINQPLTCGVWGEIFTIVLGKKSRQLDFSQTATLHYDHAYFNATLLGEIFLLMGLPPESLEFLTRGSKFSKPPLTATIVNLGGLWRLLRKEWRLITDFAHDNDRYFRPILDELKDIPCETLSTIELLDRIDHILEVLKKATYYSILAPLSYSLRQTIFQVNPNDLDYDKIPEITSIKSLQKIAIETQNLLSEAELNQLDCNNYPAFFSYLSESTEGESILNRLEKWLEEYGYLSETATDIAVSRWSEDQSHMRLMFSKFVGEKEIILKVNKDKNKSWKTSMVQPRLDLKGQVAEIYSKLLAYLRYSFVEIENKLIKEKKVLEQGDIFFLKLTEIKDLIKDETINIDKIYNLIKARKCTWEENKKIKKIPYLIYGETPQIDLTTQNDISTTKKSLQGIPASMGIKEGKIKIIKSLTEAKNIDRETIIVVPYTDAGWTTILTQAGAIISEVGGKLSHGAIIAREYHIPAVMDIPHATEIFHDGQLVKVNGNNGIVTILSQIIIEH